MEGITIKDDGEQERKGTQRMIDALFGATRTRARTSPERPPLANIEEESDSKGGTMTR